MILLSMNTCLACVIIYQKGQASMKGHLIDPDHEMR